MNESIVLALIALSASVVTILGVVSRHFIKVNLKQDEVIVKQFEELRHLTVKSIEAHASQASALRENTQATRQSTGKIADLITNLAKHG